MVFYFDFLGWNFETNINVTFLRIFYTKFCVTSRVKVNLENKRRKRKHLSDKILHLPFSKITLGRFKTVKRTTVDYIMDFDHFQKFSYFSGTSRFLRKLFFRQNINYSGQKFGMSQNCLIVLEDFRTFLFFGSPSISSKQVETSD